VTGLAPRVAFFPDTYFEVDGVANTARQFERFAVLQRLPFLTICGGEAESMEQEGALRRVVLRRGRFGFTLDKKHTFDLAFWRHYRRVEEEVRKFGPDIVHITGPSDVGQLAALVAHRLRVPLASSWHTNLHEYAGQRAASLLGWLPHSLRTSICRAAERGSLRALLRFYKIPHILFAPNQELIELLARGTGKACYPMQRGVDTTLFSPARRDRTNKMFVLGYVGRLTTEKNIRFLAELEKSLLQTGANNFRFMIVGQGAEEPWLKSQMQHADFPGVLHGEALARAYASMDVFVFPSRTDTYGNVVLEALASGVPAAVTDAGGPRFIVRHDETGFVAKDADEFVRSVQTLIAHPEQLREMRAAARKYALTASWDSVFESVYARYDQFLKSRSSATYASNTPQGIVVTRQSHQTIS
jgi:phosphatidylinositol alpha 1,6-mannosyltransferase